MNHKSNNTLIISGLKLLVIFTGLLFTQLSLAAVSEISLSCTDPNDPTTCDVSTTGSGTIPTEGIISFAANLIKSAANPGTPNPDCSLTELGGSCNIGGETPVNMGCTYDDVTNSFSCGLTDSDGQVTDAITIGCSGQDSSCSIRTDSSKFADLLPDNIVLTPNIKSLANSILSCASQNTFSDFTAICNNIVSLIQSGDDTKVQQAIAVIRSIQPLNPDASVDMNSINIRQSYNTVQQRLSRLRSGIDLADTAQTQQYFVNQEWHNAGTQLAQDDSTANDANVSVDRNISEYGKLGFFINIALIDAEQDDDIELETDSDSQIFTLGIDYRFTDNLIGGMAFNINQSETNFDASNDTSGELDSEGYAYLLYGSYYQDDWFIDASFSNGGDEYEQNRRPALSDDTYQADFHSEQLSISVTGGYDFHIQSFNITPFAQFTQGSITIDEYSEKKVSGDGVGASIAMDEQDSDIGSFNIGSHFRYIVNTNNGVFIPVASLTLVNDLEDDAQAVTGRYVGNVSAGSSFKLETNEIDSSYMIIGLGLSFQFKNGNAGFLNLETVEGYDNLDQQRLTAGWRFEF